MNKALQYEKAEAKLGLIKDFILDLIEYNNITDYYNVKEYNIMVDYIKENNYHYSIKIMRGINKPEKIFELRFESPNKINNLFAKLIIYLKGNEYFTYTSKKTTKYSLDDDKYVMNFKNNVKLLFPLKDKEDNNFYSLLEEELKLNKKIIINEENIEGYEKSLDIIQEKKAKKIIELISKLITNLYDYNNIQNYENIKPWKLIVSNKYDIKKESHVFDFNIERGNINPERVFKMNLSILNTKIVYDKLYDLLDSFIKKEELGSCSITEERLSLKLNNGIELRFEINNNKDKNFYNSFYKNNQVNNNIKNTKLLTKK